MSHGKPRPTNTLTELEPVTFPMAESANSEFLAAVILANVSGREVPMATSVIAVTDSFKPMTHPRTAAHSPTIIVIRPINIKATTNAGMPPCMSTGGIIANSSFQPMVAKCDKASKRSTSETIKSSSSTLGQSIVALVNYEPQEGFFYDTK